jgi:hypothetical protein
MARPLLYLSQADERPTWRLTPVAIRFQRSGCVFSILASIVLTVVLNLLLRACAGHGGPTW